MFDAFDNRFFIRARPAFTLACKINEIHEGTAMWLFHFVMKSSSAAALNARLCWKLKLLSATSRGKERMLRMYPEVMSFVCENHATDIFLSETDSSKHIQRNLRPCRQRNEWKLWWQRHFDTERYMISMSLREFFLDGSQEPVHSSTQSYWNVHPGSSLDDLARHATSVGVLQEGKDFTSEEGSSHLQNTWHCRGRWNSPDKNNVIESRGSTQTYTATLMNNVSAAMQIGSSPQLISPPATPNPNRSRATYVSSASLCQACLKKSHLQPQRQIIPNNKRKWLVAEYKKEWRTSHRNRRKVRIRQGH